MALSRRHEAGTKVDDLCRKLGISSGTLYNWRSKYAGLEVNEAKCFRVLNVVDDFSREMVGQLVSVSISGRQVARFLEQLCEVRNRPHKIICDNGTEFTTKAMFFWSKESAVSLGFIQPGKPTQNGLWRA